MIGGKVKLLITNTMGKMTIVKDDYGKDYEVSDLIAFKNHIEKYSPTMGKAMVAYMKRMDIGFELLKIFIINNL